MRIDEQITGLIEANRKEIGGFFLVMAVPTEEGGLVSRVIVGGCLDEIGVALTEWLAKTEEQDLAQDLVQTFLKAVIAANKARMIETTDTAMMVAGKEGEA